MAKREIWQEMDCPNGSDCDLMDDEMVYEGQPFRCPMCGETHTADTAGVQTYVIGDDGELRCLDTPKDAAELAALRNEYSENTLEGKNNGL